MQEHIPDALIAAFECQYGVHWNHAGMRNERLAMRYGWTAAMEAKQCLHQIQEPAPVQAAPAAVAVPDERAAFEKWLGIKPCGAAHDFGWSAWKARAALAATPADHVADAGKMVAAASRTTGYVAPKGRYVPPVLFSPYTGEPRDARDIASDPQGVLIVPPGALLTASSEPAAETVVLPEPFTTLVRKTSWSSDCYEASPRSNAQEYGRQWADERINVYTEQQVRALLATGGQAQAVGRGEVLVTVSGFTGSGKSAIAGEIEILCRALGLQVEWPDGESEKNMTHADWTAALEQYKPRVRIVEQNIPFVSKKGLSK